MTLLKPLPQRYGKVHGISAPVRGRRVARRLDGVRRQRDGSRTPVQLVERRDHLDQPNDYYTVNASPQTYRAPVAANVVVHLVRLHEDGSADLDPGTFDELPSYLAAEPKEPGSNVLSAFPYWVTLRDSTVVEICEQYRP